jgi:hypothetical protein
VEAETARTIERILRTEFVDEAEVLHQIHDSRPRVLAHLDLIRPYAPRSADVARIHEIYVTAWERLLTGYDRLEEGFRSGEYTKLADGREGMAAWRDGIMRVAERLRQLAQGFGIDPADVPPERAA